MFGYTFLDLLEDIYSLFWYHKNKQWARYLSPLLLFWDKNYFLTFSNLQELAKERNLIISENDFHQLKHHFNKKNGQSFLNNQDLTSSLTIEKIKTSIKSTWLYLYIDSNKKVHDFYFSNNDDFDAVKEFFRNSLASNGLPHKINAHLAEKEKMIRNKFDIIKNTPDIDIF
ncbi:transposase [Legionella santicrucis]|uniref:Transposase n=1 Tax=Legionella santicrucis TaxID=45074 RepID=A0A0W0ZBI9_9GAMM|nr:IS6 family transposase [Legionella santicrucis]KTD66549.1 transposase [Legionella santicrucis]